MLFQIGDFNRSRTIGCPGRGSESRPRKTLVWVLGEQDACRDWYIELENVVNDGLASMRLHNVAKGKPTAA